MDILKKIDKDCDKLIAFEQKNKENQKALFALVKKRAIRHIAIYNMLGMHNKTYEKKRNNCSFTSKEIRMILDYFFLS